MHLLWAQEEVGRRDARGGVGEGEEDRWSVANSSVPNSTADSWKGKGLFNPNTVNEVDSERDRGGGGGGGGGGGEGRVTEGTSSLCIQ